MGINTSRAGNNIHRPTSIDSVLRIAKAVLFHGGIKLYLEKRVGTHCIELIVQCLQPLVQAIRFLSFRFLIPRHVVTPFCFVGGLCNIS